MLVKACPNFYFVVLDKNQSGSSKNGPFATILLWAESDGAAKRAINMDVEADIVDKSGKVPPEMFPFSGEIEYQSLVDYIMESENYFPYTETRAYRIASDGIFVGRRVRVDRWEFMFRSLKKRSAETPYAIQYRLS